MADQVQWRRDTLANVTAGVPVQGEIWIDTTNWRAHIGDNATPGGHQVALTADLPAGIGGTAPANEVYAGPASGSAAAPGFRAIVAADLPASVLLTTGNLAGLSSTSTARTNLGLGTIATFASTAYAATANNLSDLASAATARTNLGVGTIATQGAGAVAITGGTIDGTVIGGTSKAAAGVTNLTVTGTSTGATAQVIPSASNGVVSAGSTVYYGPGSGGSQTTAALAGIPMPRGGTLRNLYFGSRGTAPGASQSLACTVYHNGSATALSATISGASATLASDTADTVSVAAGDLIAYQVVSSAGAASTPVSFSLEFDT